MSGTVHQEPFRHYHRKEDGTTYYSVGGEIHAAPTIENREVSQQEGVGRGAWTTRTLCKFDIEAALTIKDWESPSEFEPFRREVEQALGLPITLNALEKVRDAINAMNCEWKADYDFPGFLPVFPREGMGDDKVCWSWGTANGPWGGNDRACEESVNLIRGHVTGEMHDIVPLRIDADAKDVATAIVRFMRHVALKRVDWLNGFVNTCVKHIEQTTGTSPESIVGPWAGLSGPAAYSQARSIISTWTGSRT